MTGDSEGSTGSPNKTRSKPVTGSPLISRDEAVVVGLLFPAEKLVVTGRERVLTGRRGQHVVDEGGGRRHRGRLQRFEPGSADRRGRKTRILPGVVGRIHLEIRPRE